MAAPSPLSQLSGVLDSVVVGALTGAVGVPATRKLARLLRAALRDAGLWREPPRARRAGESGSDTGSGDDSGDEADDEATDTTDAAGVGRPLPAGGGGGRAVGRGGGGGTAAGRHAGRGPGDDPLYHLRRAVSVRSAALGAAGVAGLLVVLRRYLSWQRLRRLAFWVSVVLAVRARLTRTPVMVWLLGLSNFTPFGIGNPVGRASLPGLQRQRKLVNAVSVHGGRTLAERVGLQAFGSPRLTFGDGDGDGAPVATCCTTRTVEIAASDGSTLRLRVFTPRLARRIDLRMRGTYALRRGREVAERAAAAARAAAVDAGGTAVANARTLAFAGLRALGLASAGQGSAPLAAPADARGGGKGPHSGAASPGPPRPPRTRSANSVPSLDDLASDAAGTAGWDDPTALPVLVYYHGGGWVYFGGDGLKVYDSLCEQIARRARCVVVAPDYRVAPEHKFPVPFQDACDAVQWVLANARRIGGRADRVLVGGDSAGGNLAAAVSIRARDEGWAPKLIGQALIYPVVCHAFDSSTMQAYGGTHILSEDVMRWFSASYLRSPADASDPYAAPLACPDLSRLPPALVALAEFDVLRADGRDFAAALAAAGVSTSVVHFSGTPHGFGLMRVCYPSAQDRLVTEVAQFVRFWSEVRAEVDAASMLQAAAALSGDDGVVVGGPGDFGMVTPREPSFRIGVLPVEEGGEDDDDSRLANPFTPTA